MVRDLRIMIARHHRTFMVRIGRKQPRKVVVDRQTAPEMHGQSLRTFLPHYAALQPRLPLRHKPGSAAV